MIYSHELEKKVLSSILQHQHKWEEISSFLTEADFYHRDTKVNISIFKLLRHALDNAEKIDEYILIDRLNSLGVSFPDSIDVGEYIRSLAFIPVSEEAVVSSVKELKKYTARRHIYDACSKVCKFVKSTDPNLSCSDIIEQSDKIYNDDIQSFESAESETQNLFELMSPIIEERGNNPRQEFGMLGPHERLNEMYGSLLLGGNISVVVARSGVGKTNFCMDFTTRASKKYKVPVLHFDNGEMSEEELIFRQASSLTGLPIWLFQTGDWRSSSFNGIPAEEITKKVRNTLKEVKDMEFYYENVAGMSPDEMCSLLKRFYFSKIGRGNPLIFSFDYVKSDFSKMGDNPWQQVSYLVHRFKQAIHRELCFNNNPCVSMITSVQANRYGITTNRPAETIVDDESVVSLSDGVTQFCSHLFLLRRKVAQEVHEDGVAFGTHKLINLKSRHLGRNALRAIHDVELLDGSKKKNFINLEFKNFQIEEKGDLQDIVDFQRGDNVRVARNEGEDVPMTMRR
jgi:replicative DNA helicase